MNIACFSSSKALIPRAEETRTWSRRKQPRNEHHCKRCWTIAILYLLFPCIHPCVSTKQAKCRRVKWPEIFLPNSPYKRNKVIGILAKSFELGIVPRKNQRGPAKTHLSDDESTWLLSFLHRPDISYITPGWIDCVYTGKVNGEKIYAPKRYLLWSLRDLIEIANASSEVKPLANITGQNIEHTLPSMFEKDLLFSQLYSSIC